MDPTAHAVSTDLSLPLDAVNAALGLLDEGATIPFVARYRKEVTGGLDEVQLRGIEERAAYRRELEERRQTVLKSIEEQGKLTEELRAKILACDAKTTLEDLYLPFKPKRRTRATMARERGLEPLALRMLAQPAQGDPQAEARDFVDADKGVDNPDQALQGARDIVAEALAEDAEVRSDLRRRFRESGQLSAVATKEAKSKRTKFEQYYDFREPVATVPSHRYLAVRRGEAEKALRVSIDIDEERALPRLLDVGGLRRGSPFAAQLELAAADALKRLLLPSLATDTHAELKLRSDRAAIDIFADNLRALLLSAPLGEKAVLGVDPGLRTGCKCAAQNAAGKFLANTTLFLARGEGAKSKAARELVDFVREHEPEAIAVGNGTGGRETESFVRATLAEAGLGEIIVVLVNEAGASVYSASPLAGEEFPDLDLTVRGAISIARRLQDPLAELVKIEPKAIGVGQYQHDVSQALLSQKLDEVVESCVNAVGAELNTASAPLLARVAGIGPKLAKKIVSHREEHGLFDRRRALLDVSGLGRRTFEQAAGFLRVRGGAHPLDASAVHPERYKLVERMARDLKVSLAELIGDRERVERIELARYVDESVGEPTLRDILAELLKPGRDPRASFEPPKFRDDVRDLEDLVVGMRFEGVVTNVTAFGAFVDIGVHQDGLVHISKLADRFVRDPHEVVKPNDRIEVRVLEVDLERRRISLSARKDDAAPRRQERAKPEQRSTGTPRREPRPGGDGGFSNNPFADALKKR